MKKILLLTTGGTIACEPTGHGLAPAGDSFFQKYDYRKAFRKLYFKKSICRPEYFGQNIRNDGKEDERNTYDICVRKVCSLDSTNITPVEWRKIAQDIYDGLTDDVWYDGIVVTHGTDTMAYTLAAMEYFLNPVGRPVIFTGSQIPFGMSDSDAEKNLTDAITAAAHGSCGIYLVFGGKIINGCCAKKIYAKQKTAFESICLPDAGYIAEDGTACFAEIYPNKNDIRQWDAEKQGRTKPDTGRRKKTEFHDIKSAEPVACIKILPGQAADIMEYLIQRGYHGIILEAFGCGGIPDDESGWLQAIEKAVKSGIAVYIQSQCPYDGTDLSVYEVGQKALQAGALSADNMTTEALCVKLMLEPGIASE